MMWIGFTVTLFSNKERDMLRKIAMAIASIVLLALGYAGPSFAGPSEHLNWGAQLNASFSCPAGAPVVNVIQKVINDVDSGEAGNNWAFDEYVRRIQVVQTATGFCATVSYSGSFETIAGRGPGNTGNVAEGVVGTFEGGYTATFVATLNTAPAYRTKGSIGTFDYQCDAAGNCPGYVSWLGLYFAGVSGFDYSWWGWVYHGGNNGSWVNADSGNSGDITGN
jgi:hypothetical protein